MTFDSFDVAFFTAGFLVPGFVWSAVLSMAMPRRAMATEVRFLEFLTFSCINHGFWSWALFWIFKSGFIEQHPYWSGLCLAAIIFLSPIGFGLLSAWLQQRGLIGTFLGRFGFRTIHPIPMAWDWHFAHEKPYWVLVTLKDGSRVMGLFGQKSFAGSDPEHRDLYLEAAFRPLDNGEWAPQEDTAGVLVMPDQIAVVEFRKLISEVVYD